MSKKFYVPERAKTKKYFIAIKWSRDLIKSFFPCHTLIICMCYLMPVPNNVHILLTPVQTNPYKQMYIGALNGFHIEETMVFDR